MKNRPIQEIREQFSKLVERMDITLDDKEIVVKIIPKYRIDIFEIYNEILDYSETKTNNKMEETLSLLVDEYLRYFKNKGGLQSRYISKKIIN